MKIFRKTLEVRKKNPSNTTFKDRERRKKCTKVPEGKV